MNGSRERLGCLDSSFRPHPSSFPTGDVDQPGRSRHAQNVDSVGSNPTVTTGIVLRTGGRPAGSHKPGSWVRLPGPQLSDLVLELVYRSG